MTEHLGRPGPAQIQTDMAAQIVAAIRSITDPVDRVEAVNQTIHNLNALTGELAALTRDAVREMHKTQSYGEIGKALGVSRARAQQLATRPTAAETEAAMTAAGETEISTAARYE